MHFQMKRLTLYLFLCASAWAQSPFLNAPTKIEIGVYAGAIALDSWATQDGISQGHFYEQNPFARPFVSHGTAGQAAAALLGFSVGVGPSYLFYRTGHRKIARVWLHVFTVGETVNAIQMAHLVIAHRH